MTLQIEQTDLDNLMLDPHNPRLGLRLAEGEAAQADIALQMLDWSLEELATSFLESGFWPQEAVLCVRENVYGSDQLVVVEGNRRIAALRWLKATYDGHPPAKRWLSLIEGYPRPDALFVQVPYMEMPDRASIDDFLGYRHVTGIKEWDPAEKAEYIAFLIDQRGYSYEQVRKKIGSKTDPVRRNYIAYRVLEQMRDQEGVKMEAVLKKFSVLFLSLRTPGVRDFLGIDITAEPAQAKTPVADDKKGALVEYAKWMFGDEENDPIVSDSRQVDRFSTVLLSANAVSYLRQSTRPKLDYAFVVAGGEEAEVIELIEIAAFNIEQALSTAHLYAGSEALSGVARRVVLGAQRLESIFNSEAQKAQVPTPPSPPPPPGGGG